ncbi:undecaprenyl-phosphate glucose phosphotransferase [Terrarubrum flagellatum]|uniref:undecaprenyl-phosphate glucose phosphotransferase n=1 Tax=Terrirubrum flagellatum TaxID=2895980 RepID=UPI0031454D91
MTTADFEIVQNGSSVQSAAQAREDSATRRPIVVRQADPRFRSLFALLAPAIDVGAIFISASVAGAIYHHTFYGSPAVTEIQLQMGALIALFVIAPCILRGDYELPNYLTIDGQLLQIFKRWNVAFLFGISLTFLTKTSAVYSRGTFLVFYICGYLALAGGRVLVMSVVHRLSRNGPMLARRVFLVGVDTEVLSFVSRHWPLNHGVQVVGLANISPSALNDRAPDSEALEKELRAAVARARLSSPDDVFLLLDRNRDAVVDRAIDHFLTIPASIHLGADRMLDRFADAKVSKIGAISLLSLTRRPLSTFEVAIKRAMDVVGAATALTLLAPFALVVMLLIKLDSPGPALFRQRRYGFNQRPFRICKFRTMTTLDDGAHVQQAQANDPRITRVGHFLRRWNIDELPQLLNVLRGEMSLVGPRPHALAHDHLYMQRIALYARRHNVKPGITGWAQVNGFRGETSTDDKMRGRVEHDLHYIDNWSLTFDLKILLLTVFSPRAYLNAR